MTTVSPLRRLVAAVRVIAALCIVLWFPTTAYAQSEAVEYYGVDALGSVRVVFDADGNVLGRMDYGPFGQELFPSTGKQRGIYAGLFADDEAGLDHADARSYQVRTGRFSTVDPVYGDASDPQGWNRYAYALNNPIPFSDPSGLMARSTSPNCDRREFICVPDSYSTWILLGGAGNGRSDRGGSSRRVPPSTPPTVPPTNPPPPSPPPGPPPSPPNDCKVFASEIAVMSVAAVGAEDWIGWQMMLTANADPWHKRGVSGFKPSLTKDQGPDVYRHIFGYAGGVLATRSGGGFVVNIKFAQDVSQWIRG